MSSLAVPDSTFCLLASSRHSNSTDANNITVRIAGLMSGGVKEKVAIVLCFLKKQDCRRTTNRTLPGGTQLPPQLEHLLLTCI